MIILNDLRGQLANRLHFISYFIANSFHHNYDLLITCFPEYHDYFASGLKTSHQVKIVKRGLFQKMIHRLFNKLRTLKFVPPYLNFHSIAQLESRHIEFDINNESFIKVAKKSVVLPTGWLYRDYTNLKRYKTELRSFFSPLQQFQSIVCLEKERALLLGDTLIGVHIRRGDYETFNDGKWFYSNTLYKRKMDEVSAIFPDKNCVFVICSDCDIVEQDFKGYNVLINKRAAIVDLYLLSACDYIIGPPSTFSEWASFYNDVPLCSILSADQKISRGCFKSFI
ncbi:alpha-1,2-fucosyltransferase [Mucilaginibacter koreensis]